MIQASFRQGIDLLENPTRAPGWNYEDPVILESPGPGGWLVFGLYLPPPSALGEALANLRTVRGGGHPWTTDQAEEQLRALGFEGIETLSTSPAVSFILGQRPNGPKSI